MTSSLKVAPLPRRKVLLVDREHETQGPLIVKLRQAGYETLTARRGKDAIAIAEHDNVALTIIDPHLQDMSGAKLGAILRQRRGVPFLFLTDCATVRFENAACEAGAINILSKQTHPADLATQVQMAIRQADEIDRMQKQNQKMQERINEKINQEVFIGAMMESLGSDRKSVRQKINRFVRAQRISVDSLAEIYCTNRETIKRLEAEYTQRIAEARPDILIELDLFCSDTSCPRRSGSSSAS